MRHLTPGMPNKEQFETVMDGFAGLLLYAESQKR
jgi:hypothetical protein